MLPFGGQLSSGVTQHCSAHSAPLSPITTTRWSKRGSVLANPNSKLLGAGRQSSKAKTAFPFFLHSAASPRNYASKRRVWVGFVMLAPAERQTAKEGSSVPRSPIAGGPQSDVRPPFRALWALIPPPLPSPASSPSKLLTQLLPRGGWICWVSSQAPLPGAPVTAKLPPVAGTE